MSVCGVCLLPVGVGLTSLLCPTTWVVMMVAVNHQYLINWIGLNWKKKSHFLLGHTLHVYHYLIWLFGLLLNKLENIRDIPHNDKMCWRAFGFCELVRSVPLGMDVAPLFPKVSLSPVAQEIRFLLTAMWHFDLCQNCFRHFLFYCGCYL